jgi:arginine repressor
MHDSLTEIQSVGDQLRVAAIKGQIDLFNMLDENRMKLLQKFVIRDISDIRILEIEKAKDLNAQYSVRHQIDGLLKEQKCLKIARRKYQSMGRQLK